MPSRSKKLLIAARFAGVALSSPTNPHDPQRYGDKYTKMVAQSPIKPQAIILRVVIRITCAA